VPRHTLVGGRMGSGERVGVAISVYAGERAPHGAGRCLSRPPPCARRTASRGCCERAVGSRNFACRGFSEVRMAPIPCVASFLCVSGEASWPGVHKRWIMPLPEVLRPLVGRPHRTGRGRAEELGGERYLRERLAAAKGVA